MPGGVITEHVHPLQEERFTILTGEAHFTLNGAELVAGAGETVVVPAGVPHSAAYLPKLYAGRRPADFGEYPDQVVASLRRPGPPRRSRPPRGPVTTRLKRVLLMSRRPPWS